MQPLIWERVHSASILVVVLQLFIFVAARASSTTASDILSLRGGLVPQADETGGSYYEKYKLDYGCDDNVRIAGSMRGFIKSGSLISLPESDPFLKWLNAHVESGPREPRGRVKPFFAADIGSRSDLKKGEHPKIVIVNRKLAMDPKTGVLLKAPKTTDLEVRTIWQPWLKPRCDFVVRYIVPNRTNIIEIMESKGRFKGELQIDNRRSSGSGNQQGKGGKFGKIGKIGGKTSSGEYAKRATVNMVFKPPSLLSRLRGARRVVIKHPVDVNSLI